MSDQEALREALDERDYYRGLWRAVRSLVRHPSLPRVDRDVPAWIARHLEAIYQQEGESMEPLELTPLDEAYLILSRQTARLPTLEHLEALDRMHEARYRRLLDQFQALLTREHGGA